MNGADKQLKERFLYSNGTLKNRLHVIDADRLAEIEFATSARQATMLLELKPSINSVRDLQRIHRVLFGQIYTWAGEFRDYELSKGDTIFAPSQYFGTAIGEVNRLVAEINRTNNPTITQYATLLDRVNYLHPFREGNDRATRIFLQLLAANKGQLLQFSLNQSAMIKALNAADIGQIADLMELRTTASKAIVLPELTNNHQ